MTLKKRYSNILSSSHRLTLAFLITLLLFAELSRTLTVEDLPLSILWPPSGLIFGAAMLLGLPIALISGGVLTLWVILFEDAHPVLALLLAASQVAGIAVALHYLKRRHGGSIAPSPDNLQLSLYFRAAALAAALTASVGSGALVWSLGTRWPYDLLDVFLVYFLLEALSILLFAPLAYAVMQNPLQFARTLRQDMTTGRVGLWLLIGLILTVAITTLSGRIDYNYAIALTFAFFPTLSWLVLNARATSITVIIPAFAIIYVVFSLQGLGGLPELNTIKDLARSLLLLTGFVALLQIIALTNVSRLRLMDTFRQQAKTDFLTGLNNDRALTTRMQHLLNTATTPDSAMKHWLIYIQVLDFDHTEDLMGYRARRNLEMLLAARLMGTCGPKAHPSRIANGVYCLIVQFLDPTQLPGLVETVYDAFNDEIFKTDSHETRIRVAIGVVELDGRLTDHSLYLSAATQASLMARDRLPRIQVVEDVASMMQSRRTMTERLELIKDALSNGRLALFAQPIRPISQSDDHLSYEILIRLQDDNGDYLSPGMFLPVAEAYGLMQQIDQWVVRETLTTLSQHPDWLARTRKCSINLAGVSLSSEELLTFITDAFQDAGIPTDKVAFEVTETQHIRSREIAEKVTEGLKQMGCGVSLDDFGTGLASFDYLRSFHFDTLKIDGTFIQSILEREQDRRIVQSICDVASGMGLTTVAEFVESPETAQLLKTLGVDYGQGYGLGKPVPLHELFQTDLPSPL